jgi:hypothetical protein
MEEDTIDLETFLKTFECHRVEYTDLGIHLCYSRPSSEFHKPLRVISTCFFHASEGNVTRGDGAYIEGLSATLDGFDVLPWLRGWVLRVYVDASSFGSEMAKKLLHRAINDTRVQVVAVSCPKAATGAATMPPPLFGHHHRNLFMSVSRFFPLADADVDVCIVRNAKQRPTPLDMFTVAYWLHHTPRQFMLYDMKGYNFGYTEYSDPNVPWWWQVELSVWPRFTRVPAYFGFRMNETGAGEARERAGNLLTRIMSIVIDDGRKNRYGIDEVALTGALKEMGIIDSDSVNKVFEHAFVVPLLWEFNPDECHSLLVKSFRAERVRGGGLELVRDHEDVEYLQRALGDLKPQDSLLLRADGMAGYTLPPGCGELQRIDDITGVTRWSRSEDLEPEKWKAAFLRDDCQDARNREAKLLLERFGCEQCASIIGVIPIDPPPKRSSPGPKLADDDIVAPIKPPPNRKRKSSDSEIYNHPTQIPSRQSHDGRPLRVHRMMP